ncbi:MAG: hypothetical protein H9W81_05715 [Enterococcus sp.]|nr:hypothetical protein [Enterococcus sp.]
MNDISPFAAKINTLHKESGLNWRQVGSLFDVSERTVRWWASGYASQFNPSSVQRCDELLERISCMEEKTPEERRLRFLSSSEGMSLFHRWQKEVKKDYPILQLSSWNLYNDKFKD